jgi:hypothetical protein
MGRQNHSEWRSRALVFILLLLLLTSAPVQAYAQSAAATITTVAGTEFCS